ncbi:hypothetical protein NP493_2757g00002 [Ridgeia piscesae]|uniref:RRM domain-containing protein n=1 Tax=Ridgeia piscesae TaxID=27915 RepID=A0AAD9JCW3_RIDPI|nr:hypothetical protein NP493_2757g00002 [Ridgeia piscesae]
MGEIENVRIVRDKKFRLGKGFGYVLFKDLDSVGLALKLDGSTFRKRKLRVQRSTSNPQKAMPIAPKKGKKMKMQKTPTPDITISFCILETTAPRPDIYSEGQHC